ncbi:hypothetical protein [Actinomadura verrucosospora]|uniref:Uncharacterized protein n=1 Tax=Actinomadura verrucosospora TaxID=46165 RepID=A0A7D4A8F4_ACTVE|nr:hypothetical protein [Actinomadura verrucosospora]QKG23847.1 hypothetical protein ACTIVE_5490 [Actinomadura verrucosospora]
MRSTRPTAPRSRFTDRREDIVPRTLRDLIAADAAQRLDEGGRRRRRRRAMTARRVT